MLAFKLRWLAPATLCALAFAATAQTPPSAARKADPLDAQAAVPPVSHVSALARYRRGGEDQAVPWREANDTAARIGGWRAYAREAQQAEPAPAAPVPTSPVTDPKAKAAPQGHAGHKLP